MTMKVAALLSITVLPLSVGCYDEGEKEDCVGLKCPTGFQWPDGGEIRIWHIRLPDGTDIRRLFAYFIESQDPDVPLPEPPIGRCAPDVAGAQGENRKYIDVGESVTFHLGDGDYVVPRMVTDPTNEVCAPGTACVEGVVDFYERRHEIAYLLEMVEPVGTGYFNNRHSLTTADPQPFSDQLTGFFQPPVMEVDSPGFDPEYGVVAFKRGQDVSFEWHQPEPTDPSVVTGAAIVFVPDVPVIPTACIVPNDGQFTVPAEVIDGLEADTGIVLVGSATDEATLTAQGRIINMWGVFCQLLPWTKVD